MYGHHMISWLHRKYGKQVLNYSDYGKAISKLSWWICHWHLPMQVVLQIIFFGTSWFEKERRWYQAWFQRPLFFLSYTSFPSSQHVYSPMAVQLPGDYWGRPRRVLNWVQTLNPSHLVAPLSLVEATPGKRGDSSKMDKTIFVWWHFMTYYMCAYDM